MTAPATCWGTSLQGFLAYHTLGSQEMGLCTSKTWTIPLVPGDVGLKFISALFFSFLTPIFGTATEPECSKMLQEGHKKAPLLPHDRKCCPFRPVLSAPRGHVREMEDKMATKALPRGGK